MWGQWRCHCIRKALSEDGEDRTDGSWACIFDARLGHWGSWACIFDAGLGHWDSRACISVAK